MTEPAPTASVIVIGNEILSGRTQDTNLAYLAAGLVAQGIRLSEARIVPDSEAAIVGAVNACRARDDYVFTTGGIGPTHDDITAAAMAKAFGVPLRLDPEAYRRLQVHYGRADINAARLRMAHVPEGARLIDNPVSAAPGFQLGNVYVLAGVPRIMQAMFDGLRRGLRRGPAIYSRTITADLPEGEMAAPLAAVQERFPEVEIGSYPYFRQGRLGASIVLRATDAQRLASAAEAVRTFMHALGGAPIEA
ncbi:MAG: competence/damage-inducible protein A [Alphaproteobacteria bacterium]|nr:competence/damage-inducible protein A [Alphaproteobacteria bacterium]